VNGLAVVLLFGDKKTKKEWKGFCESSRWNLGETDGSMSPFMGFQRTLHFNVQRMLQKAEDVAIQNGTKRR